MTGLSLHIFLQKTSKLMLHLDLLQRMSQVNDDVQNSSIQSDIKDKINTVLYKNRDEKVFDYNSNIISLYGYWETFVESLIKEYLNSLRELKTGNDERNKNISQIYQQSLLPLFGKVIRKSFKYKNLTDQYIIDALYKGCCQGQNDYIPEAFMQSGGNYNYPETSDCLIRLGFKDIHSELCRYPSIKNFFMNEGKTEQNINSTEPNLLYSRLNNLVIFRNEIAHGSVGSNIIDADEMKVYVDFIRAFAESLNEYLKDDILKERWKQKKCNDIEVRQYFGKFGVAELRKGVFYIDKNQPVLCSRGSNVFPHFVYTRIKSMNVDDLPYTDDQYLSDDASQKVTLVFDYKIRRGDFLKFEE